MKKTSPAIAKLFLLGPMGLIDANGNSITPRGKKSQGLLALLALAPRRERTRVWIRDKLWSESDEHKSSTSLRQVIFELRRELGPIANDILKVDRHTIGLRAQAVWIDYWAVQDDPHLLEELGVQADVDLLEGTDVRDDEFEDWLLLERQLWHEKSDKLFKICAESAPPPNLPVLPKFPVSKMALEQCLSIAFLPSIQQGCDHATLHLADYILEGVAKNLRELQPLEIYDLRDARAHSDGLLGACDTEYCIRVRTLQIGNSLTLTFFFHHAARMTLEWSQSIQVDVEDAAKLDGTLISGFITQNVDRLARSMLAKRDCTTLGPKAPIMAGYAALNMMFRLDEKALVNAEGLLSRTHEGAPNSLYQALLIYSSSFKVGENLGSLDKSAAKDVRDLARLAQYDNPFNSISLAGMGHTLGYVFQDHTSAGHLLEKALNLNKNQAFVWDHYALHNLYTGNFEVAHKAAKRAVSLGHYSPISYSYDTTLAMTATMLGDHRLAIHSSKVALRKQPRFTAAMRYLLYNLTALDQEDDAQQVLKNLLAVDPAFADPDIQRQRFRLTQTGEENNIIKVIGRIT